MKRLIYISIFCFLVNVSYAVVATPDPIWRQLPDGTWAEVYLRGDEHYHYLTTLSGDKIPGTEVGSMTLDSIMHSAQRVAPKKMLDSYIPSHGKVRVPVILVNFTDLAFTMDNPQANFDDFYNGTGGTNPNATGSVYDYFVASSDSMLQLEFDVYGPYTLSKDMAYYGANSGSNHAQHGRDLVVEAATLAADAGVDFAPYDNNNDGYIDNLSIVVAGYNEAEGGHANTIWPHYSSVYNSTTFSGKRLSGYLMISEYRGSGGKQQAGIGTYCHEFGHVLGLPDLYDTQNSDRYTVGKWDVMCSGSYNNSGCTPPSYSAFERFALGWLIPIQLHDIGDYKLEPLMNSNSAYLIAAEEHNLSLMSPSPREYFLLENRQAVGWDANTEALVGTGMMVSHITFNATAWNRNTFNNGKILGYAIVGAYDSAPSTSTPRDLFPGTSMVTSWLPCLNDGTELQAQQVQNIRQMGDLSICFSYGPPSRDGIFFSPSKLEPILTSYDRRVIHYDTAYVEVLARNMGNDTLRIYSTNNYFEFSIDGGTTWGNETIYKYKGLPGDSVCTFPLLIRHTPHRQSCDMKTGYITLESMHSLKMQQIEVNGYSPRPIYITKPELSAAENISSKSFTACWLGQDDAEYYYATLFSLFDQPSVEQQSFDSFTSIENIEKAGWTANFIRPTTVVSESNTAILFASTDDQLISKEYILPINNLRFWISNNYISSSDVTASGSLLVEGRTSSGRWQEIGKIRIINTTKNLIKDYTFDTADSIMQVRFTYTHHAGEGGCALDGCKIGMDQTIQYICSGTEAKILSSDTSTVFYNLTPNTTYYFAVQAYENKGCEEAFSPLSDFQKIKTLSMDALESDLKVTRLASGEYIVKLPEPADGASALYVYTAQGELVYNVAVEYQTTQVQLPILPTKGIYFLKLVKVGRIHRKQPSGKLIYL